MRKNFSLLLCGILMGIFLPVFGCFAGSYSLKDLNAGIGVSTKGGVVEYDGLVPCGKCLKVTDPVAIPSVEQWLGEGKDKIDSNENTIFEARLEKFKEATNNYCANKDKDWAKNNPIAKDNSIYINCQLCHFFILIQGVINFLLINVIPYLAVLMIVIGGAMFYFGGARPELVQRGRKLIFGVLFGLFLIYGAYIIVSFFLSIINLAKVNPVSNIFKDGIFSIKCPVKIF